PGVHLVRSGGADDGRAHAVHRDRDDDLGVRLPAQRCEVPRRGCGAPRACRRPPARGAREPPRRERAPALRPRMTGDRLGRGGSVVDGTGAPPRTADVAIADGRIVAVGRIGDTAARTIDADGCVVTPGFVDVHTHYEAQLQWEPTASSASWHGVT